MEKIRNVESLRQSVSKVAKCREDIPRSTNCCVRVEDVNAFDIGSMTLDEADQSTRHGFGFVIP